MQTQLSRFGSLFMRNFQEIKTSWTSLIDGGGDFGRSKFHQRPLIGPEDDQSDFTAGEVLLVFDVLIGSDHQVKPGLFGGLQ